MTTYPTLTAALEAARLTQSQAVRLRDGRIVLAAGKTLDDLYRSGTVRASYAPANPITLTTLETRS